MLAGSVGGGKAIPKVTSVPSSPAEGDMIELSLTGRKVVMLYDGSNWVLLHSLDTMTMYVDGGSGTDSVEKGIGSGSDAFATVQYAIDTIPGGVGGNVTVNLASGTYSENVAILGKAFTGNNWLKLIGTMSTVVSEISNADIFSSKTIGKTGSGWTINAYAKKRVRIAGGTGVGQKAIIKSNTADTLTIQGWWTKAIGVIENAGVNGVAPDATSDFIIEDWDTTIDGSGIDGTVLVAGGQQNVILEDVKIINTGNFSGLKQIAGAVAEVFSCSFVGGRGIYAYQGATNIYVRSCLGTASGTTGGGVFLFYNSVTFEAQNNLIYNAGVGKIGVNIASNALGLWYGNSIDNSGSHGMLVDSGGQVTIGFTSDTACEFTNNGGWGLLAAGGGRAKFAQDADNTYSGNTSGSYSPGTDIPGGTT